MSRRFYSNEYLYRLRNEIPIPSVIAALQWPNKVRECHFRFLCPCCYEFNTATNPRTNLGRCFRCELNFNPIDIVMRVRDCNFLTAVAYLKPLLASSSTPTTTNAVPSAPPANHSL